MEYIIIALCGLCILLMVLFIVAHKKKEHIRSYFAKKLTNSNAESSRLLQELETAHVRIKNLNSDVIEYQKLTDNLKLELRKAISSNTGLEAFNSKDLNERLRFKLPDGELVNTVKVKMEREGEEVIGIQATVRKKISGKFTDVVVEPIILPASLN